MNKDNPSPTQEPGEWARKAFDLFVRLKAEYERDDECAQIEINGMIEEGGELADTYRAMLSASPTPPTGWRDIETAPKDRLIEVFAPGVHGLNDMISLCQWHPDAGFCVCELREPSHWREHLPPPSPPRETTP